MRRPALAASLRARVTLGFAVLTLLLVAVGAVAITSLDHLGGAIETILRENYRSVIACDEMKDALARQDSAAQFASSGRDEVARAMLTEHRTAFARAYAVEAHNITLPGEGTFAREIDAEYRDYVFAVDRELAVPPGPARVELYFGDLLPRFNRLKDLVQRVLRMNQAAMERADLSAKSTARRSEAIAALVGAVALLLALWFAFRLPATIVRPVNMLADAARAIGRGDLDVAVADAGVHELAPLAEAFGKMVSQLRAYRESSLGELLAAKDLANATVQCLLDPVVVLSRDGAVLLANEAAERVFGLTPGSAEEIRRAELSIPEPFARARDQVLAAGTAVAPRNLSEAMRWRDAGGERYFLVRAAPLTADVEDGGRALVVAQDVTRLRRIDALKSDMVATVSHEFKTPLTSLRMATHLLLEPSTGPLTDAQREVVTTARDDTERLRALVDELLDLVRIETEAGELHRAAVDPRRLLHGVADAHRTIAQDKGVALEVEPGDALALALLDPEKVGIVLANLVSNAVRHTPAGGRVSLGATSDGTTLRLTVRDTGEGVAQEDVARLLEPGDHTPRGSSASGGRHGLGLTIAKEIVLQHNGELVVESAPGRGSVFTVALPVDGGIDAAAKVGGPGAAARGKPPRP